MEDVCSFCGLPPESPGGLIEGGGDPDKGLPLVRICRACAEACAAAFQTEQRLEQKRSSGAPVAQELEPEPELVSGLQEKL